MTNELDVYRVVCDVFERNDEFSRESVQQSVNAYLDALREHHAVQDVISSTRLDPDNGSMVIDFVLPEGSPGYEHLMAKVNAGTHFVDENNCVQELLPYIAHHERGFRHALDDLVERKRIWSYETEEVADGVTSIRVAAMPQKWYEIRVDTKSSA